MLVEAKQVETRECSAGRLVQAERMLREEAEADSALRQQFGARWARTESAKLTDAFRANADKYRQIIDNAVRADAIVQQKLAQHRDNIALLGGSEQEGKWPRNKILLFKKNKQHLMIFH